MHSKLLATLLLLTLASLQVSPTHALDSCRKAYQQCDFRLTATNRLPTYRLRRGTRRPFTGRIRAKSRGIIIGITNSNGVSAELITPGGAFRLPKFGSPRFTSSHFKPMRLGKGNSRSRSKRGSGIGHERLVGVQLLQAQGKCVRVFFTSFQILDHRGRVLRIVQNVRRSARKCVVFRTK